MARALQTWSLPNPCFDERKTSGEIIYIDIKKLGRFERAGHRITGNRRSQSAFRGCRQSGYGWEFVRVAIDDHSRLSFTQIQPDEKAVSAVQHLEAAVAWYRSLGIAVSGIMTDDGSLHPNCAPRMGL